MKQKIPKAATTLLFPLDTASKTYYTGSYSPEQIENKASSQEVDEFISQIESEYKLHRNKKDRSFIILGVFLGLQLFLTIFLRMRYRYLFKKMELAILQILFLLTARLLFKRRSYSIPQLRAKCQDLVDERNETMRERDLRWNLPEQFPAWIELCKDNKRKNEAPVEGARQEEETSESSIINHNKPSKEARKHLIARQTGVTIVFPFENRRFSKSFYSTGLTDRRVSHKEVQQVLAKMNVEYRNYYEKCEDFISSCLLYLGMQLFSLWYACNHFSSMFSMTEIIIAGVFLNLINLKVFKTKLSNIDEELKKNCQKIIDEENQAFESRKMKWSLPNEFPGWIELFKENTKPSSDDNQSTIELASDSTNTESINQDLEEQNDQSYNQKGKNKKYAPLATDESVNPDEVSPL